VTRWKVILSAIIIFVAGAATGAAISRGFPRAMPKRTNGQPAPFNGDHRRSYLQRLDREVQLTPDQRAKVEKILSDGQARMKKLWEPVAPRAKEEYRRTRQEISEVLTPEQREKMKNMRRGWDKNHQNQKGDHKSLEKSGIPENSKI
jgi:Spy/CpxP family protein refolding chaperone